jgi:hypothetical protein
MIDDGSLRELVSRGADPISGRVVDLESRVTDRAERLGRRRRVVRVGAAVAAAMAVVVGMVVWGLTGDPSPRELATRGPSIVAVPSPGGVSAEFLDDGRPVFVVHHPDGEVTVLSAVSPHRPVVPHLVGWCSTNQTFEDPVTGSRFDAYGSKFGGPSPTDLVAYETRSASDDSVEVVAPREPAADRGGLPSEGPSCLGGAESTPPYPAYAPAPGLVLHTVDTGTAVELAEATRRGSDEARLLKGFRVDDSGDVLRICDDDADVCVDAPEMTPPADDAQAIYDEIERGFLLARVTPLALVDVVWISPNHPTEPAGDETTSRPGQDTVGPLPATDSFRVSVERRAAALGWVEEMAVLRGGDATPTRHLAFTIPDGRGVDLTIEKLDGSPDNVLPGNPAANGFVPRNGVEVARLDSDIPGNGRIFAVRSDDVMISAGLLPPRDWATGTADPNAEIRETSFSLDELEAMVLELLDQDFEL